MELVLSLLSFDSCLKLAERRVEVGRDDGGGPAEEQSRCGPGELHLVVVRPLGNDRSLVWCFA